MTGLWSASVPSVAWSASGAVVVAQHDHGGVFGAASLGGVWLRLATVLALVVVAGFALLRPFGGVGARARVVAVVAASVGVVGELALAPTAGERLDPRAVVLPVVLVTGALAVLPVLGWSRRAKAGGYGTAAVGALALVLGTDPAAVGDLLAGDWSQTALRSSALAWVAALAWFALGVPARPVASRVVRGAAFVVAVALVAALPGFTAAGGHAVGPTEPLRPSSTASGTSPAGGPAGASSGS